MSIFSSTSDSKLSKFQSSTNSAISMFTKALADLAKTNQEIQAEATSTIAKVQELEVFADKLKEQQTANDRLIQRIKSIVED